MAGAAPPIREIAVPHLPDVLIAPADASSSVTSLVLVREGALETTLAAGDPGLRALAAAAGFKAKSGQIHAVAGSGGAVDRILVGCGGEAEEAAAALRGAASRLPPGLYRLDAAQETPEAALGFALGRYRFDRYKSRRDPDEARLVVADGAMLKGARRLAEACALTRDLVNTPANDMGPAELEQAAADLAQRFGAEAQVVRGEALLAANYPAVHAVGRAAAPGREPRMIEVDWRGSGAEADAPLIALVGKGVVFDTGGLDIKPSAGMRWMKKDMGGAAHVLGLAQAVMDADLPLRLKVLIPAVENAISADAMRPGDVLATRAGITVEIGNTDAEGRLVLADALTRAGEASPALTLDYATLTGAARVALGPEVPPFFTRDEKLALAFAGASHEARDPVWRLPLWAGYEASLESDVADLKNDPDGWAQAGSVTAALFLQRFAPLSGGWIHLDVFAWNPRSRPGWPVGGEAQGLRAAFRLLQDWRG